MPDNLRITHPQDASRINIHQEHDVQYWTKKLGVTKKELEDAVNAVGTSVSAVKKYLGKQ